MFLLLPKARAWLHKFLYVQGIRVTSYSQWQTEGTKVRQSHILVVWAKFHAAGDFLQLYWQLH